MRPLLGEDFVQEKLRFPLLASPKLDGIRGLIGGGKPMSRTWRPLPNLHIQSHMSTQLEGLDGELIVGSPTADDCYRSTMSGVMSGDGQPDFMYYVFDYYNGAKGMPYQERYQTLVSSTSYFNQFPFIKLVQHTLIESPEELEAYEEEHVVNLGYEGVMVRCPNGPYKQGRSTVNQGYLLKIKRFTDGEGIIVGFKERMHNANKAIVNSQGYTERSTHQANKVPMGTLGALIVRDEANFPELDIPLGTGFSDELRQQIWDNQDKFIGKLAKYKHFKIGAKVAPRIPVFLGLRDKIDL